MSCSAARYVGVKKVGDTYHDFPHLSGSRCPHIWIINVTPAGKPHCIHDCPFCYARWMTYSDRSWDAPLRFYNNLREVVERELEELFLAPPIYISSVTDPCQNVEPLRREVKRLVELLVEKGISLSVTTKGDPGFVLDIVKKRGFERFLLQVSIEGPQEVVSITSPKALSYKERLEVVRKASSMGAAVCVRLDPFFYHIYLGLFGERWTEVLKEILEDFKRAGARYVIGSTGRFSGREMFDEKGNFIGVDFEIYCQLCEDLGVPKGIVKKEHVRERRRGIKGVYLTQPLLKLFHLRARTAAKSVGIEYYACDGDGNCGAYNLPFCRREGDRFLPIEGCSSRCRVCALDHPFCSHLRGIEGPIRKRQLRDIPLSPIERFLLCGS